MDEDAEAGLVVQMMKDVMTGKTMPRTVKKARKAAKPKWQTHVYLDEATYKHLAQVATEECRSVTGQVEHFIRRGLAERDKRQ